MLTYQPYDGLFSSVWLWNEFPYRHEFGSGQDIGIDLVCKTFGNEYWAVQCKCYADDIAISKADVDSFLSASGKQFHTDSDALLSFSHRLWISTTNKWSSHAEDALRDQLLAVSRLNLSDLASARVDWDKLDAGIFGEPARFELRKMLLLRFTLIFSIMIAAEITYQKKDGISDFILGKAKTLYQTTDITKEELFYYVYGILHSPMYRETFSADLKKMLPRIPLVSSYDDFTAFSQAGWELADLHLHYETVEPYADAVVTGTDAGNFRVTKMRFPQKGQKDTILYKNPCRQRIRIDSLQRKKKLYG